MEGTETDVSHVERREIDEVHNKVLGKASLLSGGALGRRGLLVTQMLEGIDGNLGVFMDLLMNVAVEGEPIA